MKNDAKTLAARVIRNTSLLFAATAGLFLWTAGHAEHGPTFDVDARYPAYSQVVATQHDCVAPVQGELPSAVVMLKVGDIAATYHTSPKAVGDALDHAINHVDNDVREVYAFCR